MPEAPFYCLEALPMFVTLLLGNIFHPGQDWANIPGFEGILGVSGYDLHWALRDFRDIQAGIEASIAPRLRGSVLHFHFPFILLTLGSFISDSSAARFGYISHVMSKKPAF
ncbi:hypothetical protein FB451DRAFT_1407699 [Mycena latifolia]|nr:hypothetical protein FB451DRAFT_1407699 [Mycena latifolia]